MVLKKFVIIFFCSVLCVNKEADLCSPLTVKVVAES